LLFAARAARSSAISAGRSVWRAVCLFCLFLGVFLLVGCVVDGVDGVGWIGLDWGQGERKENTPFLIDAVETAQLGLEVGVSSLAAELVPVAGAVAAHLKDDMVAAGGKEGYPVASHGV
jgi:hypothetical protein